MREGRHYAGAVALLPLVAALTLATPAQGQTHGDRDALAPVDARRAPIARSIGIDASIRALVTARLTGTSRWRSLVRSIGRHVAVTPIVTAPVFDSWRAIEYSPFATAAYYDAPFDARSRSQYAIGVRVPLVP